MHVSSFMAMSRVHETEGGRAGDSEAKGTTQNENFCFSLSIRGN